MISSLDRIMGNRHSVRGFLPQPVDHALIRHILKLSQRSASNCNIQPWLVHLLSGAAAERMRSNLVAAAERGEQVSPDLTSSEPYPGIYRTRQIEAAKALYDATGVAREDKEGRRRSLLRNYSFFGAPHVAFLFMPDWAGEAEAINLGMYAQTFMLALEAHGVGSCAQGALGHFAPLVRAELGVGDNLRLIFGIAFGYEDVSHPANRARTSRANVDDVVTFHA